MGEIRNTIITLSVIILFRRFRLCVEIHFMTVIVQKDKVGKSL